MNANREHIGAWEMLTLSDLNGGSLQDGDKMTLDTGAGWYLHVAGNGDAATLEATVPTSQGPGVTERFRIHKLNGGDATIRHGDWVAMSTNENRYVVAEGGGGDTSVVNANRQSVEGWKRLCLS